MNVEEILQEMALNFQNKIDKDYTVVVQFIIQDAAWHVTVKQGVATVKTGHHDHPHILFVTTVEALQAIYCGEMTALTAAGKAKASDAAPLDWKLPENVEFTPELLEKVYIFIQHFFTTRTLKKIVLGEQYSRLVHGGHAIPLFYHLGFRSVWYLLKKGEKLNEPGDTNPFPQGVIFVKGSGFAKIGDETIPVKAGEAYYIPPGSDHVVWTESDSPLVMIWLAWGKGA